MFPDKLEPNISDHSDGANWSDNTSLYKSQPVSLTLTDRGSELSIVTFFEILLEPADAMISRLKEDFKSM